MTCMQEGLLASFLPGGLFEHAFAGCIFIWPYLFYGWVFSMLFSIQSWLFDGLKWWLSWSFSNFPVTSKEKSVSGKILQHPADLPSEPTGRAHLCGVASSFLFTSSSVLDGSWPPQHFVLDPCGELHSFLIWVQKSDQRSPGLAMNQDPKIKFVPQTNPFCQASLLKTAWHDMEEILGVSLWFENTSFALGMLFQIALRSSNLEDVTIPEKTSQSKRAWSLTTFLPELWKRIPKSPIPLFLHLTWHWVSRAQCVHHCHNPGSVPALVEELSWSLICQLRCTCLTLLINWYREWTILFEGNNSDRIALPNHPQITIYCEYNATCETLFFA